MYLCLHQIEIHFIILMLKFLKTSLYCFHCNRNGKKKLWYYSEPKEINKMETKLILIYNIEWYYKILTRLVWESKAKTFTLCNSILKFIQCNTASTK
jgi:hypothetical protein